MTTELATDYYRTSEEYLAAELMSGEKHEYLAGVVCAMAGASAGHNRITGNIAAELRDQLRGKSCQEFSTEMKVCIRKGAAEFYYYPDVTVDCSPLPDTSFFSEEPRVIFEVLSPQTERIDRGEKLQNYQSLDSLSAYILVDQARVAVTVYRRKNEVWGREVLTAKDDILGLPEIDCELTLTAIYERTDLVHQ
ncbi:MAG: Uma2 family endonuclease [Chthoniobacterales bacterium]